MLLLSRPSLGVAGIDDPDSSLTASRLLCEQLDLTGRSQRSWSQPPAARFLFP